MILLIENKDVISKAITFTNGSIQRGLKDQEDVKIPTSEIESPLLSSVIDAK